MTQDTSSESPYVTAAELDELKRAVDIGWMLSAGVVIFLMNAGFAMLESGSVRFKNLQVVLIKNMVHALLGGLIWWAWGFAFAFGNVDGGFMGSKYFLGIGLGEDGMHAQWWLSYTFAAAATSIVSGSVAERINVYTYVCFSIFMFGFIYPLIAAWTWGRGWLYVVGYEDFAGSGVVHITGGFAGLMGAVICGPRLGRFEDVRTGQPIASESAA